MKVKTNSMTTTIWTKAIVCLLIFTGALQINMSAQAYPIVYNQNNYTGKSLTLTESSYNMDALVSTVGNDAIRSIRVPAGFKVTLYEHGNFHGREVSVTEDVVNLAIVDAPAISAIKIARVEVKENVIECEGKQYKYDAQHNAYQKVSGSWKLIGNNCKELVCARRRVFKYQVDGPLMRYNGTPNSWTEANTLLAGQFLNGGTVMGGAHYLASANNGFFFYMQENGDLGIWTNAHPAKNIYSSNTRERKNCTLKMQEDGNLVIYDASDAPVWSSETHTYWNPQYGDRKYKPVKLVLENDGKIVLYSATGFKVWDNKNGKYPLN